MRVISTFDGMACGKLSLEKAGIELTSYCASEINKHAIQCSSTNHPEIIHMGDINRIDGQKVRNMAGGSIDLLIGGSPCQDLSGLSDGDGLNGNKSKLFYEFFRLKSELPEADFLLENVVPKKQVWADMISEKLGVKPVLINSSSVMPYSRPRLYWASFNIEPITPVHRSFSDFIDFSSCENTMSDGWHEWFDRNKDYQLQKKYSCIVNPKDQGICLTARQYASWNGNFIPTPSGKYRKPTKKELALLVGAPVNYFDCVSQRQAEEMTGNGWTIPVTTHIFQCFKKSKGHKIELANVTDSINHNAKGAYITHSIRTAYSEQRIKQAISELTESGHRISKSAVSRLSGISREQISRRYSHLFAT